MKRSFVFLAVIFFFPAISHCQFTRYLVKLKNKANGGYTLANPAAYLSQRAIQRRLRYQLPIDSADLPVSAGYISQIAAVPNVTVLNISKWLNQISIQTSDAAAIDLINALPFVQIVNRIAARNQTGPANKKLEEKISPLIPSTSQRILKAAADHYDYGSGSLNEMHLHHGEFLHNIGLRGSNLQVALLDAGFYHYNLLDAFDSIMINGQVLDTWDFVAREASVAEDNSHGMSCLSTIAANLPGQFIGTAPETYFYLYRTEDISSEYPIEEHNWVCAAERADSSGADVISSSLGYTTFDNPVFNHSYSDLNGNSTQAAIGADMAAKKGILVFIAAGNEGSNAWHYIMTPADADSIIAVGAVDARGLKGGFSSFGPSADQRVKPDAMSIGVKAIIETTGNAPGISQGTSYACPKLAGLGICLWQGFPEFNNIQIIDAIRKSGNRFSQPSDSTGYGIPDLRLAFTDLLSLFATSSVTIQDCAATLHWTSKDAGSMKYKIERKLPRETVFSTIAEILPVAGSVLRNQTYSFRDSLLNTSSGPLSYRILQEVDSSLNDKVAVYIDTALVSLANACVSNQPGLENTLVLIAPNPVQDELKLIVRGSAAIPDLLINIYDMQGRLMLQRHQSKAPGRADYTVPTSTLAKGKYQVVLYDSDKRIYSSAMVKL